jgi:predicted peptidase
VLDVMADVEANYSVDLERVFSGGYSMGGYGTLRMATTYPDRFAGYIDWVGYPGDASATRDPAGPGGRGRHSRRSG